MMRNVLLSKKIAVFLIALMTLITGQVARATTYYLNPTGAAAQTLSNWWTNSNGTGSNPTSFSVSNDIFNIPLGINGIVSADWKLNGDQNNVTLNVDGTLTINSGVVLTLESKNTANTVMRVNGSLIFMDTSNNQLIGSLSGNYKGANTFTLTSGATLKTVNTSGIISTNGSINSTYLTTTFNQGANYEFNGSSQLTTGLPSTINNLTLSGSGTKTFSAATTISGNLSIISGVVANLGTFSSTANTMSIGGEGVESGSWGSSSSAATYKNDTYFSATIGIINITTSTCIAPSAPTVTNASICIGSSATLSASGATAGRKYNWYSAASGGTLLKTSANNTDNTYTTLVLSATTDYWVSILSAGGCESARTKVTATFPAVSSDSQTAAGSNSWVGHVYDGTNSGVAFDGNFTNYYGSYTETETFDQSFGGSQTCFGFLSNSVARSIYTETYSVRYRMNSTKKGLYVADLGSDDGSRLSVDGILIHNNWTDQGFNSRPGVLMTLNGSSSLVYGFYENGGQNRVVFQNLTLVLANNLSTNATQTICTGSTGAAIGGDVYGTLPTGITLSGTGYQWAWGNSPSGPWTDISGATAST